MNLGPSWTEVVLTCGNLIKMDLDKVGSAAGLPDMLLFYFSIVLRLRPSPAMGLKGENSAI